MVLEAVKTYQLELDTVHLDSSSFSVQGEYETTREESEPRAEGSGHVSLRGMVPEPSE